MLFVNDDVAIAGTYVKGAQQACQLLHKAE